MTTAIAAIGGSLLGGLTNQSRSPAAAQPRHQDTSTAGIALARDLKTAKQARINAREERLMSLLTDPQVMGLITVLGGLLLANRIPWSEDKGTRARISGVAAAACVLMGLGRAGVGDMTTLLVAGMAGVASASEGSLGGLIPENIPGTSLPLYTVTPYGSLYYLFEKAKDLL